MWRLLIVLLLALSGAAEADHGPRPSRLDGTVLCLDAASVRAAVERPDERRDGELEQRLEAGLLEEMEAVLMRLEVAFERRPGCHGAPAYSQLQLTARFLDPAVYLNFPERSYGYAVILQVGDYDEITALELEETAPEALHVLFQNGLHSEADTGREVGELLTSIGSGQVRTLARAWWDDNAQRAARRPSAAPLIGGGLAALVVLGCALGLRRFSNRRG